MTFEYRNWMGIYLFFASFCVVSINMIFVIHVILIQKNKSDQWRFGSSADRSCFLNCLKRFFFCFGLKASDKTKTSDHSINNKAPLSKKGLADDTSECVPSVDTCLEPVGLLSTPTFHMSRNGNTKIPYEVRGELVDAPNAVAPAAYPATENYSAFNVKELNGLITTKIRAPASLSGTDSDPYRFNLRKIRSSLVVSDADLSVKYEDVSTKDDLRKAQSSLIVDADLSNGDANGVEDDELEGKANVRALTSRTGTETDAYAFDLKRVRVSIRQEATKFNDDDDDDDDDLENSDIGVKDGLPKSASGGGGSSRVPLRRLSSNISTEDTGATVSRELSREDEAITQALLYMACFLISFIFPVIARTMEAQGIHIPFWLLILSRVFLPMQGFFVVQVYCRPHAITIRRINPEFSRFQAFIIAFKAGGDNDSIGKSKRAGGGLILNDVQKKKRIDNIQFEHKQRMENIKRKSMVSQEFLDKRFLLSEINDKAENNEADDDADEVKSVLCAKIVTWHNSVDEELGESIVV
jgi:hypothetical protein